MRRVADTASTSGRVNRRASRAATRAATSRPMTPTRKKYLNPSAGSWAWRVMTTTGTYPVTPESGVGTAV